MFNFYYDPQRQGFDAGLWKVLAGAPAIASNKLVINADEIIQYADCVRGVYNFAISFPTIPNNATLTGGASATAVPATWAAVTDGEFTITIDGSAYDVVEIDFSSITTMDEVAALIETYIRNTTGDLTTTVVWSTNKFIITATTSISVTSAVSAGAGTDISGAGATAFMDSETGRGTVADGDDKEFGLKQKNQDVYAVAKMNGSSFQFITKDAKGVTETSNIPWVSAWTATETVFSIHWTGQGFLFKAGSTVLASHNGSSIFKPMSIYLRNTDADNMILGFVEGLGIESYL